MIKRLFLDNISCKVLLLSGIGPNLFAAFIFQVRYFELFQDLGEISFDFIEKRKNEFYLALELAVDFYEEPYFLGDAENRIVDCFVSSFLLLFF